MKKSTHLLLAALCAFAISTAAQAQDTNNLQTAIGVFEDRPDLVIIKGFDQIGSISVGNEEIAVRYKETIEAHGGARIYGLAIVINGNVAPRERIYVDYDEINPLLNGLDYLIKISDDVTSLPAFEAFYSTKSGLKFIANSDRKNGGIRNSLQYADHPRIWLSSVQMTQLYNYIAQAKQDLDAMKSGK
jgi:hypothetical protein